jgi:phenylpropionate dioxygenase-like ring-hydroxylating dioxygenase large terminal subunit
MPRAGWAVEPSADAWYAVARSSSVGASPLAVELLGAPLAVARLPDGKPIALLDRCPHRNVPLSIGTTRTDGLECAYHGWRFDDEGACVAIPGLCQRVPPKARVDAHRAMDSDGWLWVYGRPGVQPASPPFRFPLVDDSRYATVSRALFMEGALVDVAENALDVPHTAFLHRGLFRGGDARRTIEVEVRELEDRVEAEYIGEPAPKGALGRLLAPGGGAVEHVDRFLLPSVAQVEYRLGARSHLLATIALTPAGPQRTMMAANVTFRLPIPGELVAPLLTPIVLKVLAQDAKMLRIQRDNVARFGEARYTSTPLDALGPAIVRLLRGERAPSERATRRLTMTIG